MIDVYDEIVPQKGHLATIEVRAYGEELKAGEGYSEQPPVICVTFANGSFDDGESQKIHKCCKIVDIDDHTIFSDALELY